MKKFSIVICTYNGEKYLKQVLDSIWVLDGIDFLVETVLVVDNASTDTTADIIKNMMKDHGLLKYVYEEKPGLSYARRHAADMETEWVIYFDDDNIPCESWLLHSDKITNIPRLGAFGGRNIARPEVDISDSGIICLEAALSNMACHYKNMDDYLHKRDNMAPLSVFGAGMTIKTELLKAYIEDGWSVSTGRKKNELGAYEDTEMLNFVQRQGYKVEAYDEMYLYHIIPSFRTDIEYIKRLRRGMEISENKYLAAQDNGYAIRKKRAVRNLMRIIKYSFYYIIEKSPARKLRYKLFVESAIYDIRDFMRLKG